MKKLKLTATERQAVYLAVVFQVKQTPMGDQLVPKMYLADQFEQIDKIAKILKGKATVDFDKEGRLQIEGFTAGELEFEDANFQLIQNAIQQRGGYSLFEKNLKEQLNG